MAAGMEALAAKDGDREFHFTQRDFNRVRSMIYDRAGISLSPAKQDLVYSRIARRLRATGERVFSAYLDALEQDRASPEWEAFVNALTTNLTSFFRESHHFDMLREHLQRQPHGETLRIWCSAASTGEEPYSIAIAAAEAFGTLRPPVAILATDIDTNVLAVAQRGVYPLDRIEKVSLERRRRYFRRGAGDNQGQCKVVDELRNLVSFRQLNLLDSAWGLKGPFTAIFCRNVMIYFDKPTQHKILQRFAPLLSPDGLLFTGHSESLFNVASLYGSVGRTVYRRLARTTAPASR
ncbi:chemotaxis protein CheR [Sinimarinibacterium sp. CAU 1509]|uniref:CheR family methyltransferase n=1 Tax=Sinimarinibacterium sp. CAU 1509 TaxID=2562283 RepID=UPI0010AD9362|nr:CheR family methyltransferase [Sinimarinibacterium sp. CAU 1509]TJY62826.1 chemotaxis protein CheR [Sinimarinibacterium sp. CAU 1509]